MSRSFLLGQLQNLDNQIAARKLAIARQSSSLDEAGPLASALAARARAEALVLSLQTRLADAELQAQGAADKLKGVSARLYGGRVSNPKELEGLEQDARMLKRNKDHLEDQALDLMTLLETAQKEAQQALEEVVRREGEHRLREAEIKRELESGQAALDELERQRALLVARIPSEDYAAYAELLRTRGGRAAASIKGQACSACGMDVPSGLKSRALTSDVLVICPGCGRILVP